MSRHRLPVLVPTLLSIAAAGFAAEQPAPAPAPQPKTETAPATGEKIVATGEREEGGFKPETVNATKLQMPIEETPQSITVIPRALMDSQGSFSLRDAVRNAPGLTIASGEGGVTGDAFTIRGFSANNDIYIDGMKDNGQYFRDTFYIEQVEVLKGSSALLFGRGSVGGAINQVTRKPTDEWTANASATAGTDNLYRGSVGFGGPVVKDLLGVRADAFLHTADSFRDNIHVDRKGAALGVLVKIDEKSDVLLQSFNQREKSDIDYGLPRWRGRPADVDISTYYGFKDDDFQEFDVDQYTLTYNHRVNDHVTLRNSTRYSEYERTYRVNIPNSSPATASTAPSVPPVAANPNGIIYNTDPSLDTVGITQALRRNTQRNVFNQTDATVTGDIAKHEASLLAGMELGQENYDFRGRNSTGTRRVSVFDPQQADTWGAGRADDLNVLNNHNHSQATTVAFYAMGTIEIVERLTAVAGLRWDQYDASYATGAGVTTPNATTQLARQDRMVSPRAGLVYKVLEDTTVYASWGTSFSPSLENISGSLTASTPASAGTADLEPEKTNTFEVGSKVDLLDNRLLISGAVFRVEKHNARVTDPAGVTSLDGNQRSDGVELGVAGTITENWKLFAGGSLIHATYHEWNAETTYFDYDNPIVNGGLVTFQRKTVSQEGKRVTGTPNVSSTLWTTYDIGKTGLTVGGGMVHVGKRYINAANSEYLPSYVRFDATVGYKIRASDVDWTAQVNVFNVLDKRYYEATHPNFTTPGTPASGQLTLSATF